MPHLYSHLLVDGSGIRSCRTQVSPGLLACWLPINRDTGASFSNPLPLMNATRRALAYSFLDRYASLLINIGSSMVIARLLTPADIGVFSVSMVLFSLLSTFRDFGAGQYMLQERDLTPDKIRAVWSVQLGAGTLLAIVAALASWPMAQFYSDQRITLILQIVAVSFLVTPFGSLTYAWLSREMRFDALAVMRFVATAVGAAVSISLAFLGWGPVSLALGALASSVATALVSMPLRPAHFPWLPGTKELGRVARFGSAAASRNLLNTLNDGLPELILGKLHSMAAAGLLSRANGLVTMFQRLIMDAVYSVAAAAFARDAREGRPLTAALEPATLYLTTLGWTFCAAMAVGAEPIILLMYGPQWTSAAEATQWIAAAAAITMPSAFFTAALMAKGLAGTVLGMTFGAFVARLVLIAVTASSGFNAVAMAMVAANVAMSAIWFGVTARHIPIFTMPWRRMLGQSALPAVLVGLGAWIGLAASGSAGTLVQVTMLVALSAAGLAAGLFMARHPLGAEVVRAARTAWARIRAGRAGS